MELPKDLENNIIIKKENDKLNKQNQVHQNEIKNIQKIKINLDKSKTDKDLIKEQILLYSKPTLIGLNNIGTPTFINSTL